MDVLVLMDRWMDGKIDGRMDRWKDGLTDGWRDASMYANFGVN